MNEPQVFKLLAILSPLACEVSDVKENISHLVSIVVTIIAIVKFLFCGLLVFLRKENIMLKVWGKDKDGLK